MSPQWNYAKLTHNASLAGGPEAFIQMNRWIGAGEGILTYLVIMGIHYLFDKCIYAPLTEAHLKADKILFDADAEDYSTLAERLAAIENTYEFEEPHATCDIEETLFSYLASNEIGEEDKVFIRIAKAHPAYRSFEKEYQKHYPDADEVTIVKEFARMIAPYEKR